MKLHTAALCGGLTWALGIAAPAAQSPRPDPGEWTIDYAVAGGIAFNLHALRVTRQGDLTATDRRLRMDVAGRASEELLAKLNAFVGTARDAKKAPPMPDAIGTSLSIAVQGRQRDVEPTREITVALESAWDDAVRHALLGSWTQSGWTLCNPSVQMAAETIDTPIDVLTFRDNGTFEVTWRGGGARTSASPNVTIPDYTGRYTLTPPVGAIQFSVPPPVPAPRDFAGDGAFHIAGRELTLTRVWLGTSKVPRRPEICDLTFSRK